MDYHFSKDPKVVKSTYQGRKMKIIIFLGIFAVLVQHISCLPHPEGCKGELIGSHSQPYLDQRGADSSPKYLLDDKTRSSNICPELTSNK